MTYSPDRSVSAWFERWLLPAIAVAALLIAIVGIGRFLRLDEANSVIIAGSSFGRLLDYLRNDNNLPLYYMFLHVWIRAAGITEAAVHLPSAVFYLAAVAVTYLLGREVSGNRQGALYSSFFYLVSLQAIHQAQKTRMYSLLGLLAALSVLFFFRNCWREKVSTRDWVWYVVVNVAGTFVHVWYFFVLFAQAVCVLLFQPKKVRPLALAMLTSVLPFAVLWARNVPQQARIGAVDWMPHVHLRFFPGVFGEFYGGERWGLMFLVVVLAICIAGLRDPIRRTTFPFRGVAALVTITLLCTMVPLLFSLIRPIYWPGRYTMIALPALAAALGCSLAVLSTTGVRVTFAYAVLVIVVALHVHDRHKVFENSSNVYAEAESDKAATLQLCRQAGPQDTFVFTGLARAGVEYYFRRLECAPQLGLVSIPGDTADHQGWVRRADPQELRAEGHTIAQQFLAAKRDQQRLWLIPAHGGRLDEAIVREVLDQDLGTGNALPLRGSFFDEVVVYGAGNTSARAPSRP